MNTQTVTDFISELSPAQIEELSSAVGSVVIGGTLLFKARRAARAGNYAKATYLAVLWVGYTNNYAQTAVLRIHRRTTPGAFALDSLRR